MIILSAAYLLMPILAVVAGVKIYMYFKDHNPPHFHARYEDDEEVFDLEGNSIKGRLPKKKAKRIRKWAQKNEQGLKRKWDEFQE